MPTQSDFDRYYSWITGVGGKGPNRDEYTPEQRVLYAINALAAEDQRAAAANRRAFTDPRRDESGQWSGPIVDAVMAALSNANYAMNRPQRRLVNASPLNPQGAKRGPQSFARPGDTRPKLDLTTVLQAMASVPGGTPPGEPPPSGGVPANMNPGVVGSLIRPGVDVTKGDVPPVRVPVNMAPDIINRVVRTVTGTPPPARPGEGGNPWQWLLDAKGAAKGDEGNSLDKITQALVGGYEGGASEAYRDKGVTKGDEGNQIERLGGEGVPWTWYNKGVLKGDEANAIDKITQALAGGYGGGSTWEGTQADKNALKADEGNTVEKMGDEEGPVAQPPRASVAEVLKSLQGYFEAMAPRAIHSPYPPSVYGYEGGDETSQRVYRDRRNMAPGSTGIPANMGGGELTGIPGTGIDPTGQDIVDIIKRTFENGSPWGWQATLPGGRDPRVNPQRGPVVPPSTALDIRFGVPMSESDAMAITEMGYVGKQSIGSDGTPIWTFWDGNNLISQVALKKMLAFARAGGYQGSDSLTPGHAALPNSAALDPRFFPQGG